MMSNSFPSNDHSIAYFISPHGFGHAARSAAVMAALQAACPEIHFHIFTRVPRWFFDESLGSGFTYHEVKTDIGLVQSSPLVEDMGATLAELGGFLPFAPALVDKLAQQISAYHCRVVLCDIAPLGIAAANKAGIPSVLIENFTWDWIYEGYLPRYGAFKPHIDYLRAVFFEQAGYHIQTEPLCEAYSQRQLITAPVGRKPRQTPARVRERLNIPAAAKMVLITMGGIQERFTFLERISGGGDVYYVVPGGSDDVQVRNNLVLLPHHSEFYHPDLIHASDAIIGKAGYSTIAEAYHAGIAFGYINRTGFRESGPLTDYIRQHIPGFEILGSDFKTGRWLDQVPDLLALPRVQRTQQNGADQIAGWVCCQFFGG